jgi:hypothetical protein
MRDFTLNRQDAKDAKKEFFEPQRRRDAKIELINRDFLCASAPLRFILVLLGAPGVVAVN